MVADFFYVLNYPALIVGFFTIISLVLSAVFKIRIEEKHIKIGLVLLMISIPIISFNYQPSTYTDLYRYYNTLDVMRITGGHFYNTHEVFSDLIFRAVAKTSYNNWLPFITSIIRYSVFFTVFLRYIKIEKQSSYSIKMFLIFHLAFFPIVESISGVRYYLAITFMFSGLIYGLKYKKRLREIIFMVLGLLVHTSSIVYLGLRVLVIERIYNVIKHFRYIIVLWPIGIEIFARVLINFNSKITYSAANMLIFYTEEIRVISARLTVARILILLLLILMFFAVKKDHDCYRKSITYYRYLELVFLFTIGSIRYAVFFQRSIFFIALISMPLIIDYFSSRNISKNKKKLFSFCIILLSLGMIANQVYGVYAGYF